MKIVLGLLLAVSAWGQAYPSNIYNPYIAKNNIQTKLQAAMSPSDTVAVVSNPAGWVPQMLAYICDSTTSSLTCTGTYEILVVTNVSGNVLTVTRGIDGTTAISHGAGKSFSNNPVAAYINSANTEIKAIENTLGPNLSNVTGSGGFLVSTAYNFPPQTPGNSLIAGTNVIDLVPCPNGVNGSNTHHYLYISGGTGTAEAALITGGTCTSGASSGTVIVTTANTHTGSWTIASATAGIQEAMYSPGGHNILIPYGTGAVNLFGTVWGLGNTTITCAALGAPVLAWNSLTAKMFDFERSNMAIRNCQLEQAGTATGSVGIYTAGSGSAITGAVAEVVTLENVWVENFYDNIIINGSGQAVTLNSITCAGAKHDCLTGNGAQGYWSQITVENNVGNGVTINNCAATPNCGWSPYISGLQTFNNGGWGLEASFQIQISGQSSFFNADKLGGIHLKAPLQSGGFIADAWIQLEGDTINFGSSNTARGILIDSGVNSTVIKNINFFSISGNCIENLGNLSSMTDINEIGSCGTGLQSGNIYSIKSVGQENIISGNHAQGPYYVSGSFNVITNNSIGAASGSTPVLYLPMSPNTNMSGNFIFNASGGGVGFQCDSGGSIAFASNVIGGTVTNNCAMAQLNTMTGTSSIISTAVLTAGTTENWIATQGGSNNAITLTLTDSNGVAVPLVNGLRLTFRLSTNTLQAGANTIVFNGSSAKDLKSSRNPANNIGTAYAAGGMVSVMYDGVRFMDLSQ